jgi:hypothetical protein
MLLVNQLEIVTVVSLMEPPLAPCDTRRLMFLVITKDQRNRISLTTLVGVIYFFNMWSRT